MSERDQAIQARQEARRQAYVANIIAAGSALSANEVASARRRLEAAPKEFRNWEWRFFNAELDDSLAVLLGDDSSLRSVAYRPDGTLLALGLDGKVVRLCDASTG